MTNAFQLGDLLIADPSIIGDETFHRSAIYISAIQESSPMGFIINKPFEFSLAEVLPEIRNKELPLYYGGLIDNDLLFVLHNAEELANCSKHIKHKTYFSGEVEKAIEALNQGLLNQSNCRFFLGYSGWSTGQLENEKKQSNWLSQNLKPKNIFSLNTKSLWRDAIKSQGGDYHLWVNTPDNPGYN